MKTSTSAMILLTGLLAASACVGGCAPSSIRNSARSNDINSSIADSQRRRAEARTHYTRATELAEDGKPEEALDEYRSALELDDQLYAAWNNMGQLLMAKGNYADAVSAYQIAAGIETSDPRPIYNIGLAYQRVGWAQDAYDSFERALRRDENYMPALRGLVRSAEMLGMGNEELLGRIKQAQLRERDEQWRSYFIDQRDRVRSLIDHQ